MAASFFFPENALCFLSMLKLSREEEKLQSRVFEESGSAPTLAAFNPRPSLRTSSGNRSGVDRQRAPGRAPGRRRGLCLSCFRLVSKRNEKRMPLKCDGSGDLTLNCWFNCTEHACLHCIVESRRRGA